MPFDSETKLVVEQLDKNCWELRAPLIYHGGKETFTIEEGFRTDFATVPFFLTWLVPRYGSYTNAAVLHDWLLKQKRLSRCDCDGIFRRALREIGVPFLRRWVMWAGVRLGSIPKERSLCTAREGLALLVLLAAGAAITIVPALVVLAVLAAFWLLEVLSWLALRLWPFTNPRKRLSRPAFPWPRKGDCRDLPAVAADLPAVGSEPEMPARTDRKPSPDDGG